jgi:hypothetical protein
MTRILFIGQKPETVDFSDPALPPGFDAAKINAGIAIAVQTIEERGWQVDPCMITPDEAGLAQLDRQLRARRYDCVVIGGGCACRPQGCATGLHRLQHPPGRHGGGSRAADRVRRKHERVFITICSLVSGLLWLPPVMQEVSDRVGG